MNTSARHRYKRSHCQTPAGSQLWAPKQEVKNANRSAFFGKQGRKQATCSHFLCPPGGEGSRAPCTRGHSGCTPCPQASTCREEGRPAPRQQKPASLPAVAWAGPRLQNARRGGDSPTPCAALGPRALGGGVWARWSQGAAIWGREWRLESRGHVLSS